jgi:membrane protein
MYAVRAVRAVRAVEREVGTRSGTSAGQRIQWPWELDARTWWRIALRVVADLSQDHVSLVSAALAFYAILALFPGLLALVSLYGLSANPEDVELAITRLSALLPSSAWETLQGELRALVELGSTNLSLAFFISLIGALWSVASGVDALIEAVNLAYGTREQRSYVWRRGTSLLVSVGLVVFAILAIALVAVLPGVLALFPRNTLFLAVLSAARWPVLTALIALGLLTLYRVAPYRARPRCWVLSGALLASGLWLAISSIFSLYVSEFGSYHKTYGALGGVIVLLLWLYLSAYLVLLGAEVTAALEGEQARSADASARSVQRC